MPVFGATGLFGCPEILRSLCSLRMTTGVRSAIHNAQCTMHNAQFTIHNGCPSNDGDVGLPRRCAPRNDRDEDGDETNHLAPSVSVSPVAPTVSVGAVRPWPTAKANERRGNGGKRAPGGGSGEAANDPKLGLEARIGHGSAQDDDRKAGAEASG